MAIVGAYELHLYCDCLRHVAVYNDMPHQFIGKGFKDTMAEARLRGWSFRSERAWCPKCVKSFGKVDLSISKERGEV